MSLRVAVGDTVEIRYPDGVIEPGIVTARDAATVTVRRTGADNDGAFIVPIRRLRPATPGRWRLDL